MSQAPKPRRRRPPPVPPHVQEQIERARNHPSSRDRARLQDGMARRLGQERLTSKGISADPSEWIDFPPEVDAPATKQPAAHAMIEELLRYCVGLQAEITRCAALIAAGESDLARQRLETTAEGMDRLPSPGDMPREWPEYKS